MGPFAVVSRCLAAIVVLITLTWSRDLFSLAGSHGLLDPALSAGIFGSLPLSLFHLVSPDSPSFNVALLLLVNATAISAAVLFWRPRSVLAALALYITFVCFKQTIFLMAYGVYEFLQLGLFYVLVANAAGFAFRKDEEGAYRAERLVGLFFRGHLAMGYVFAGACKAIGPQWWTGESLWRALCRTDSTGQRWFDFTWTGQFPILLQVLGIGVVLMETLYPLAFFRKLRPFFVFGMMAMHFGTILSQGLTLFGLTMIALNAYFWLESKEWESRRRTTRDQSSQGAIYDPA